jgi:hypothetical protein
MDCLQKKLLLMEQEQKSPSLERRSFAEKLADYIAARKFTERSIEHIPQYTPAAQTERLERAEYWMQKAMSEAKDSGKDRSAYMTSIRIAEEYAKEVGSCIFPRDKKKIRDVYEANHKLNFLEEILRGNVDFEINSDGDVLDNNHKKVGCIWSNGDVWDEHSKEIGKIYSDGEIYLGHNKMAKLYSDGEIFDDDYGCVKSNRSLGLQIRKRRGLDERDNGPDFSLYFLGIASSG